MNVECKTNRSSEHGLLGEVLEYKNILKNTHIRYTWMQGVMESTFFGWCREDICQEERPSREEFWKWHRQNNP